MTRIGKDIKAMQLALRKDVAIVKVNRTTCTYMLTAVQNEPIPRIC